MVHEVIFYIFAGAALLVAGVFVLFMVTAMCERQVLSGDVEPASEPYPYSPSPYWHATRNEAVRLGLRHAGEFATKKHTTLVKGLQSMWVTQDDLVIAAIISGCFAGAKSKKTVLRSRLSNGRLIESSDEPGLDDISQTVDRGVLLNAGLEELLGFHVKRIVDSGSLPLQFNRNSILAEFERVDLEKGKRMVELGQARWADPQRTTIRMRLRGALAHIAQSYFKQMGKLAPQQDRINLPRAGTSKPSRPA